MDTILHFFQHTFTAIGIISFLLFNIGLAMDIADFDNTKGGYSAPYADYSGEPVDWFKMDRTPTGLVKRGHVANVHVDGTTGMISFEIFRQKINFRPFSERALVVHKPRETFIKLGFSPEF